LGIGRVGAIVGPYIGGQLLDLQWPTQQLFLVFAGPALVSTLVMLALHFLLRTPRAAMPLQEETA
jgi:MFS family permease